MPYPEELCAKDVKFHFESYYKIVLLMKSHYSFDTSFLQECGGCMRADAGTTETRQADRVVCRDSRSGTSGIKVKTAEVGDWGWCLYLGRGNALCLPCVTVIVPAKQ